MIFFSAQPDDYYFLWQLELQLYNFHNAGIPANQVHVLIGYEPQHGLRWEFQEFIRTNRFAEFYIYPDKREKKEYPSSIRPHIIKQHLAAYPELNRAYFFYHDSDILLNSVPDFDGMADDDAWYVSDTRSYLDVKYIKSTGGEVLFIEMCEVVGIPPEKVLANDGHAGGAQYLLKNTSYDFWDKIERDCEGLYGLLTEYNNIQGERFYLENGKPISKYYGIQAWCADMWALLWNAWHFGHEVKIHPDLDFCWPHENIKKWQEKKVLHYAGITDKENKKLFCKGRYIHYPPYYDSLDSVDETTCSYPIVELIRNYLQEKKSKRIDLSDVSFLIPVRIDSEDRMENLMIISKYLDSHFKTNVIILEADKKPKIDEHKLPESVRYFFYEDMNESFYHTRYNNILLQFSETPIISIYDTDVIFPTTQVLDGVSLIREKKADCVYPYNGTFISVDRLFKAMFGKLLDAELFIQNVGKFASGTYRSYGGAVFLNCHSFIEAGMDNENIDSWGPEDLERPKRMEILGYKVKRVDGPLFHLPHERSMNSGYVDLRTRVRLMEEYLKICSFNNGELKGYVNSWEWVRSRQIKWVNNRVWN